MIPGIDLGTKGGKYALEGLGLLGTAGKYLDEGAEAGETITGVLDDLVEDTGKVTNDIAEGTGKAAEEVIEGAGENFTTGSFDDLPSNAQNAYKGYEGNDWNGNYSGQAPGTKAGKIYQNADDLLPKTDSAGNMITYREFDINSPTQGVGRDAERFVVGSDGSVYYSDSHYGQRTSPAGLPLFTRIK